MGQTVFTPLELSVNPKEEQLLLTHDFSYSPPRFYMFTKELMDIKKRTTDFSL